LKTNGRNVTHASSLPHRALARAGLAILVSACAPPTPVPPFDMDRTSAELGKRRLATCRKSGPPIDGHVTVVFAPSGKAQSAIVDGGALVGTETAKCVEALFLEAEVAPFAGPAGTVRRHFRLE
jgi:hypothetical protein